MSDKIYFIYERMDPKRYPEPRDVKQKLFARVVNKYKNSPLSEIDESTEVILKSLKPKDDMPERPILKYKVINIEWETTKDIKDVNFESKMFKWYNDPQNFEETGDH